MKRKKFFIGGFIILAVVGYLVYSGVRDLGVYYFTVGELKAKRVYNQGVRVGGKVLPGSIIWDMPNMKLNFELYDAGNKIKVFYQGIVPDAFKEDNEVLVEGEYSPASSAGISEDVFVATTLLAKCPSKYKAKLKTN